jgi:hypothetical protein
MDDLRKINDFSKSYPPELTYYQKNRERILKRQKEYYQKKKLTQLSLNKQNRLVIIQKDVMVTFF